MRAKGTWVVMLWICSLSLGYTDAVLDKSVVTAPSKSQGQKDNGYTVRFLVAKAEIQKKADHLVLVVPKTPRNYQFIYESNPPQDKVGTLSAKRMEKLWAPGATFNKSPPTTFILSVDKRNNVTYAVKLISMRDDGKNLVFDMVELPGKGQKIKFGKLYGLVMTIDGFSIGGP